MQIRGNWLLKICYFFVNLQFEMKYVKLIYTTTIACLLTLMGCSSPSETGESQRAMYFWRTTWQPSPAEIQFLNTHKINRLYMRFFDVVMKEEGVMPDATISIIDSIPNNLEIVPVVFIKDECLSKENNLATLIGRRLLQMGETLDIPFKEVQVDCDWRESTREDFFKFVEELKDFLHGKDIKLSSTIRLHQLSQEAPPADYGVLMCYNTGNLHDYRTENSVLDAKDVKLYTKSLSKYDLPLNVAYPVFSWKLLFIDNKFSAILRGTDLSDTATFCKIDDSHYQVVRSHSEPSPDRNEFGLRMCKGDIVKWDKATTNTIKEVKTLVEHEREDLKKQIILYSLNETDLNRYSYEEIESFFAAN